MKASNLIVRRLMPCVPAPVNSVHVTFT